MATTRPTPAEVIKVCRRCGTDKPIRSRQDAAEAEVARLRGALLPLLPWFRETLGLARGDILAKANDAVLRASDVEQIVDALARPREERADGC